MPKGPSCSQCGEKYDESKHRPCKLPCNQHSLCISCIFPNYSPQDQTFKCQQCPQGNQDYQIQMQDLMTLEVDQEKLEQSRQKSGFCKIHGEQKKLYCMQDNALICIVCQCEEHSGHDVKGLPKAAEILKGTLLAQSQEMFNIKMAEIESKLSFYTEETVNCEEQTQNAVRLLEAKGEEMIALIIKVVREKQNKLLGLLDAIKKVNEAKIQELDQFKVAMAKIGGLNVQETYSMVKFVQKMQKLDVELLQNDQPIKHSIRYESRGIDAQAVRKHFEISVTQQKIANTFKGPMQISFDSSILANQEDIQFVVDKLETATKTELLYRFPRDGDEQFHERCDHKAPLLVLIKADSGKVFGGVSFVPFDSSEGYKEDNSGKSFLFSITQQSLHRCIDNRYAICNDPDYASNFGGGIDICILKQLSSSNHYSNLGHSYELPQGIQKGSNEARSYLAGSRPFKMSAYEVFQVFL